MKRFVKMLSVFVVLTIIVTSCIVSFSAEDNNNDLVRVSVRNDVFSKADGAAWDGLLLDTWVECEKETTAVSAFIKALEKFGFEQTGAESGYITAINGLSAGDNGSMSGWSFMINDWFTDEGINAYTFESGKLSGGDEIQFCYSNSYGSDLGFDWSDNTAELSGVYINGEYTDTGLDRNGENEKVIHLSTAENSITVVPSVVNRMYQARVYKNEYKPEEPGYKRSDIISVEDGDVIYVGVGDELWPAMSKAGDPALYKFRIELIDDDTLMSVNSKIDEMADYYNYMISESSSVFGFEWPLLTLFRTGNYYDSYKDRYLEELTNQITESGSEILSATRSTDNSKAIMILSAMGVDARNIEGYNLLKPLSDLEYVKKQGVNGCIYALIALDTYFYDISENENDQNIREKLISEILASELENGGWTWFGDNMEPDLTGMAIISLAPYYDSDENVKSGVDKAVERLSQAQDKNGRYLSWGTYSSENISQVIIGLSSNEIDANNDERFVKECGCVDALMEYSVENGFSHEYGSDYNSYASEQAFQALASYMRYSSRYSNCSLYDMRDVIPESVKFDADSDGEVSVTDVTVIQNYLAGNIDLSDIAVLRTAGINGELDIICASRIQNYLVNIS